MTVFAVDAFVFISGYYGVRLSFRKVVRLLGLGVFAVAIVGSISGCLGSIWNFSFSLGWFGNCYLALICLSPVVEFAIDRIKTRGENALKLVWTPFAFIFFLNWLSFDWVDLHVEGWGGHSFATMFFVYLTGRMIRLYRDAIRLERGRLLCVFCSAAGANLALAWLRYKGIFHGGGGVQFSVRNHYGSIVHLDSRKA